MMAALLGAMTLTTPIVAAEAQAQAPTTQPAAPPGSAAPQAITVDQITDHPSAYVGARVTVIGDVEDVIGGRALTLEDQDLLFDDQLLVVSSKPFADQPDRAIENDDLMSQTLKVQGTIQIFNEAVFEDLLGIQLDDARFDAWANRPALIADRLMTWSPAIPTPWTSGEARGTATAVPSSIESIATQPTSHYDHTATVGGYVHEVLGSQSFVLEDGDLLDPERVLVVTRQPAEGLPGLESARGLRTDGYVWVSGTVHQFNRAAFEQQFGVMLDDPRLDAWAGHPAIVAESVVPVRSGGQARQPTASMPRSGAGESSAQRQPSRAPEQPGASNQSTDLQGNSGIDAILNAPDSYVGQTLTLSGRVLQRVGPRALVLSDADAEAEQVLVISLLSLPGTFAGGDDAVPDAGQVVDVTGEIWRFQLSAVEQRIGTDLDDSLFQGWTGKPVLIATAIAPTPR